MKILILGGTRFLGYHLTARLVNDGHQVTLFNRGRTPDDFGDKVDRIRGDRYDSSSFHQQLRDKKFDVVIDMIAYNREDSFEAINIFFGKVAHFIHISTAAVYIIVKNYPCPLKEEDSKGELYPRPESWADLWDYGFNKMKCEEVLMEAFREKGFPVMIIRPPIIMGEKDYTLRAYSYFLRLLDGKPLILPDGGLNVFTHVYQGDIVQTIALNLMNHKSFGKIYNLAQEEIVSLRTFVLEASRIIGKKVELIDIPSWVLDRASLGTSFSPFSERRPFVLDVGRAKKDLNFVSTPFSIWMEKTITWFMEKYEGDPPQNYSLRPKEIEIIEKYKKAMESIF